MGLLDVLTGMRNGPRGGASSGGGMGGMSAIALAALGLLAYKAVKGFSAPTGNSADGKPAGSGSPLGDLLGKLGAGGGAGGLGASLSGGLGDLLKQFQNSGKGDVADSWVSTRQNKSIAATDLESVLNDEQIAFLTERTGLSRADLLKGLAEELPATVDRLTPAGRVPTADELERTA